MGRMIRKQVYIAPHQDAALRRRARELGISEAEVIRRGIDHVTGEAHARDDGADEQHEEAWTSFLAFAERRGRMRVPQTARQWTRDDLYDERLDRVARR